MISAAPVVICRYLLLCVKAVQSLAVAVLPTSPAGSLTCTNTEAKLKGRRLPAWKLRTPSPSLKFRLAAPWLILYCSFQDDDLIFNERRSWSRHSTTWTCSCLLMANDQIELRGFAAMKHWTANKRRIDQFESQLNNLKRQHHCSCSGSL